MYALPNQHHLQSPTSNKHPLSSIEQALLPKSTPRIISIVRDNINHRLIQISHQARRRIGRERQTTRQRARIARLRKASNNLLQRQRNRNIRDALGHIHHGLGAPGIKRIPNILPMQRGRHTKLIPLGRILIRRREEPGITINHKFTHSNNHTLKIILVPKPPVVHRRVQHARHRALHLRASSRQALSDKRLELRVRADKRVSKHKTLERIARRQDLDGFVEAAGGQQLRDWNRGVDAVGDGAVGEGAKGAGDADGERVGELQG